MLFSSHLYLLLSVRTKHINKYKFILHSHKQLEFKKSIRSLVGVFKESLRSLGGVLEEQHFGLHVAVFSWERFPKELFDLDAMNRKMFS